MDFFESLNNGNRKDYISKMVSFVAFLKYLPNDIKPNSDISKTYISELVHRIATEAGIHPSFVAYAMYHFGEEITQYDLDVERNMICGVYNAYQRDDGSLKVNLIKSNKYRLASPKAARDAFELSFEQFYHKYRYYTESSIGKFKAPHIHIVFYYDYKNNHKFNLYTLRQNLLGTFGNEKGSLNGLTNPYIPFGDINQAVRYLAHTDNSYKKMFDPANIVCINCNDGLLRFHKGAPVTDIGDCFLRICDIVRDKEITSYSDLCRFLKRCDITLYAFSVSAKGKSYALQAISEEKTRKYAESRKTERTEDLSYRKQLIADINGINRSLNSFVFGNSKK